MRKRRWRDSELENYGLSSSLLKTLDTVETALEGVERVNASIRSVENLSSVISATSSIRAMDDLISNSAVKTANDRLTDASAVADRVSALSRGSGLGSVAATRMFPTAKDTMMGNLARSSSLFGNSTDLLQGSSVASHVAKVSDSFKGLAGTPTSGLFSKMTGLEGRKLEMPVYRFSGLDQMGIGSIQKELRSYSVLKDLHSSFFATKELQSSSVSKDLQSGFSPETLSEIFGATNRIAEWSAAQQLKDHWMTDLMRGGGLNTGLDGFLKRMMPTFDSVGRYWGGIIESIGRIDFEELEKAARIQEARRPRTKIGHAALKAFDALHMGHPWVVDRFLSDYLGIEPNADRREALWTVLRQAFERNVTYPARWIVLDDERATRYLRAAVYYEVSRIERDREMADRIWWSEGEEERDQEGVKLSKPALSSDATLAFLIRKSPSPEDLLIPALDDRGQVLSLLYQEGSDEDREFVRLLLTGHELPDIARIYGWTKVQRFTRKARRWRRIMLNPPLDG